MAFEIKNGEGLMFVTETKKNEKEPDFRGQFRAPDGHLYEIAGWKRMSKTNKKMLSLKVQEPRAASDQPKQAQTTGAW